jgi:hypothetical protein
VSSAFFRCNSSRALADNPGTVRLSCLTIFHMPTAPRLVRAWLDSLSSGIVEFDRDWESSAPPGDRALRGVEVTAFKRAPGPGRGQDLPLLPDGPGDLCLCASHKEKRGRSRGRHGVRGGPVQRLAGGRGQRGLAPQARGAGRREGPDLDRAGGQGARGRGHLFKFVTGENQWLHPLRRRAQLRPGRGGQRQPGHRSGRTGAHLWRFELAAPLDLAGAWTVAAGADVSRGPAAARARGLLLRPRDGPAARRDRLRAATTFRIFAPRAETVTCTPASDLARARRPTRSRWPGGATRTAPRASGRWSSTATCTAGSTGTRSRGTGPTGSSHRKTDVLDPYALATVGREGPGIVLDRAWVGGRRGVPDARAGRTWSSPRPTSATWRRRRPSRRRRRSAGDSPACEMGRGPGFLPPPPRGQLRRAPARAGIRQQDARGVPLGLHDERVLRPGEQLLALAGGGLGGARAPGSSSRRSTARHGRHPRRRLQPRGRAGPPHVRSTGSTTSSRIRRATWPTGAAAATTCARARRWRRG